jgi:hypothetical protein
MKIREVFRQSDDRGYGHGRVAGLSTCLSRPKKSLQINTLILSFVYIAFLILPLVYKSSIFFEIVFPYSMYFYICFMHIAWIMIIDA